MTIRRYRALPLLVLVGLLAGLLAAKAGPATAATATSCPNVNQKTHAVSPKPAPGVDWSGCDLSQANLRNADLSSSNLSGANLTSANLSGATFGEVNLTGATLTDAKFTEAMFADSMMFGVSSGGITGAPKSMPAYWLLIGGYVAGPGVNLAGADLDGLDLSGADLDQVTSGGVTGTPTALPDNWLLIDGYLIGPKANLADANLSGADLTAADLTQVSSGGITAAVAPELPADWSLINGYLIGPGAELKGANLSGANLTGVDLETSSDPVTDLTNANLTNANLTNANFLEVILSGGTLTGANLTGTVLGADLDGVISGGITTTPAFLPTHWILYNGYLVGQGANLTGADLTGIDLSNSNNYSDLELTDANLTNANFSNSFLSSSVFTGSNLSGANLSGAVLNFVTSGGIIATDATTLPSGWSLVGGYLVGTTADLTGASLPGADLAGLDLRTSTFTNADLAGANLSGTNLASGTAANVNLTGADLDGTDLMNTPLTGADLQGAAITNANFFGGNLSGAVDPNATWSNDICPDGSNSDSHIDGCLTARATTPPAVTVTGVRANRVYVLGAVPKPGCETTDETVVVTPATLTVTTKGRNGVGAFTATCAGAVDRAGNKQAAPVRVTYLVVYGFGGYTSPVPGKTLPKTTKTITVRFRLVNAAGAALSPALARALAKARAVRVTFQGPGVKTVTAACDWKSTAQEFGCTIKISGKVKTGSARRYILAAAENLGTGLVLVPHVGKTANPLIIGFS